MLCNGLMTFWLTYRAPNSRLFLCLIVQTEHFELVPFSFWDISFWDICPAAQKSIHCQRSIWWKRKWKALLSSKSMEVCKGFASPYTVKAQNRNNNLWRFSKPFVSIFIEGSLEVKLLTIWTDEKQSSAEAERRERSEERRVEEKE